jgi:ribosomal protein L12E/L44/L45/RPP1/RPP2
VNGQALHFYLAGINNQNFLMRDHETGTWWQQVTGKAIYGPLKGATLELVLSDELSFGQWRTEFPEGQVLAPVAKYTKEYDPNWEPDVAKLPVVISFPGTELKSRDVVIGLTVDGSARAYPWDVFTKQSPVLDRVNGTPLLVILGPDGKSFRVFVSRIDGHDAEFFLQANTKPDAPAAMPAATQTEKAPDAKPDAPKKEEAKNNATKDDATKSDTKDDASKNEWTLLDTTTNSQWNFQGCATSGPAQGKCLARIPALKDYWFDWRNYHPDTTVYKH